MEKVGWLLAEEIETAERISDAYYKATALRGIAESYAKLGDKEKAISLMVKVIKTAELISYSRSKVDTLREIAGSYTKLAESLNDRTWCDKAFGMIEGSRDDVSRNKILDGILSSKFAVADVGKLRSLASHYSSDAGRAGALARILMACSHPELIGKKE
jgi:hypothetical protein